MRRASIVGLLTVSLSLAVATGAQEKPQDAGDASSAPPAGAMVLFDGKDLSQWTKADGSPAEWTIKDGYVEGRPPASGHGENDIQTKQKFKDFHLHLEFWVPKTPESVKGEAKSNSGVFLQRFYEIQILDSASKEPAGKGDCGALYRQKAPDVNAALPAEQWQTYDIDFKAARFDEKKNRTSKAVVSIVHNGKTVQKDVEIDGATRRGASESGDNEDVIILQYHGHPVRFRNVWIEPKEDSK